MDKKLLIIGVAIVVIVVIAAVVFIGLGGKSDDGSQRVDGRLWILGNADGDLDIDNDDVKYIEERVKDKSLIRGDDKKWCDANYDSVIDQKDVDFVKTLIKGKSDVIYYQNYNGMDSNNNLISQVIKFRVPDADKPVYLMLEARCLAEEVLVVINKNPDHYKVVAASKQCFDYDGQLQFSKQTNPKVMQTTNSNITLDEITILEETYTDGSLILCMGADNYYNKGIEEKIAGYGNTQVVRLPSWERGLTLTGLMTFGYLFGSQGDIKGKTSWDMAQDYAKWNIKYTTIITEAVKDLKDSDKKTMANMVITETNGTYVYKIQTSSSDPYNYSVEAGAKNFGDKFGSAQSGGNNVEISKSDLAIMYDVDAIVLQTSGEAFDKINGPKRSTDCLNLGVSALDGWISPDADIYAMSFAFFNGAPYVISMILYAQFLYDDIPAISKLDYKEIYKEYLDLIGWGDRDLSYLVIYSGPGHTKTA